MTVRQLPHRCWVIRPELPGEDGDRHYDSRADALDAIREARRDDADWWAWRKPFRSRLTALHQLWARCRPGRPKPRQIPAPCWVIQCNGCDQLIDEEDEGYIAHCDSRRDAEDTMAAWEWAYHGDLVFCPADAPQGAVLPPPSPAEQEAAGQLRFPGVLPFERRKHERKTG